MTQQFIEQLALVANSDRGVGLLRDTVLDLAVRGLLVIQDQVEESAVGGRAATLSAWPEIRLGDLALVERGGSPRPIKEFITDAPDGLNWIKIGDTDKGGKYITSAAEKIRPEGLSKTRRVYPGDFLLTNSMSFGRPYITQIEGCIHDGWLRISPSARLYRDYLYILLSSPYARRFFVSAAAGAVVMNLNAEKVRDLPVLLPPLGEQHRIVAKVDELMALCDRLEARQQDAEAAHARLVQVLLDSLNRTCDADEFQACLQRVAGQFPALFTTTASISKLWSTVLCLAAEGKLVQAGEQVDHRPIGELLLGDTLNGCSYKPSETPVGIPILRISAGTGSDDFVVDETDHKWLEVTAAESEKFRLFPNDLLACRFNGNLHYVGAFALYKGASGAQQIFPDKLIRFRVDDKRVLPGYLRFVMNALPARQQIESFCATTVGNIGISATNLKTVKVRIPSLEEQRRIVAKVIELLALCDQLKARIAAARAKRAQLAEALVVHAVAA